MYIDFIRQINTVCSGNLEKHRLSSKENKTMNLRYVAMAQIRFFFLIFLLSPMFAWAIVDVRTGSFSDIWTDLIIPGSGYNLQIKRAYNSRSVFKGMFGFGWCSELESKLTITAMGDLALTECGSGLKLIFRSKNSGHKNAENLIAKIINKKKKTHNLRESYYKKLRAQLKYDSDFMESMARQSRIEGQLDSHKVFYADGRKNESIKIEGKFYIRQLPDGRYEKYNQKGLLKSIYDKNGNYISIHHKKKKINFLTDNRGNQLKFHYSQEEKRVISITGRKGLKVTYKYKGKNLIGVQNSWKNVYRYKYDRLHNLVQIAFSDKTKKSIKYDKDTGRVLNFTDRRGCREFYTYKESKKNSLSNYTVDVKKKCRNKVTSKAFYSFFYKLNKSGHRYLFRLIDNKNGDIREVRYHEIFGKPTLTVKNNLRTDFNYYGPNHKWAGLLKTKIIGDKKSAFKYENSCNKVSQMVNNYYQPTRLLASHTNNSPSKINKRTLRRRVVSRFKYSQVKCDLIIARNSLGQASYITYDQRGRIQSIKDQSQNKILIKYKESTGKPKVITQVGIGSVFISYKPDGSINEVKSQKGILVITKVSSVYSNMMQLIVPVSRELNV